MSSSHPSYPLCIFFRKYFILHITAAASNNTPSLPESINVIVNNKVSILKNEVFLCQSNWKCLWNLEDRLFHRTNNIYHSKKPTQPTWIIPLGRRINKKQFPYTLHRLIWVGEELAAHVKEHPHAWLCFFYFQSFFVCVYLPVDVFLYTSLMKRLTKM